MLVNPGLVGNLLIEEAVQFARMLGIDEEIQQKIDINWINRFKSRHSIVSTKINSESVPSPIAQVILWKDLVLPGVIKGFDMRAF